MFNIQGNELGSNDDLFKLQQNRNEAAGNSALVQAAVGLQNSILNRDPSQTEAFRKVTDANISEADKGIQQYKDRVDNQKNDPASPISQAFREYAKNLGFDIKGDFSAATAEKIIPDMFKDFENKQKQQQLLDTAAENRKSRTEDLKYKYDQLNAQKKMQYDTMRQNAKDRAEDKKRYEDEKKQFKQDLDVDHRTDRIVKSAQEQLASGRTPFGIAAKNFQSVQNAEALLNGQDLDLLDNREVYETAKVLDRILSQGNPTISGSKALTPETAPIILGKYIEFIKNERQPARAKSFMERTAKTLSREKDVAKKQMNSTVVDLFSGHRDLYENSRSRQRLMDVLENKGISVDDLVFNKNKEEKISKPIQTETNKNKPKQIMQNGHTYILNPVTGQYE
jgi:hypothetical protein